MSRWTTVRPKFPPLRSSEESPFQRVLETGVVLSPLAPRNLGSGATDSEAVQNPVVPGSIVGALDAAGVPGPLGSLPVDPNEATAPAAVPGPTA